MSAIDYKMMNSFLSWMEKEGMRVTDDRPVILNEMEQRLANNLTKQIKNALGYDIQITTLTQISKRISEQKFFQVAPADYMPVVVGEGAWSDQITTYRSFNVADSFESGILNNGGQTSRLASADAAVDAVSILTYPWAKEITWSIPELEFAARSGNWNIVASKEKSRKTNWDLGIQKVAFLGADGNNGSGGSCCGLLNQSSVNINTTVITKAISSMSAAELKIFQAAIVNAYRANNNRTAWPTHFIIPESDYLGLASQASADFPIKSTLQLLEEAFKVITNNPAFKILPLAYADSAYHTTASSIVGKQVYMLLNYDEDSLKMEIPVDYTNTLANSLNNFQMQNVGYGMFTGVQVLRPLEALYFQY